MKIKNFTELATTNLRSDGLSILNAGLEAIETSAVLRNTLSLSENTLTIAEKTYDITLFSRVRVAGAGKCSADAVTAISGILGERLTDGFVIDVQQQDVPACIELAVGTHPLASAENVLATSKLLSFLESCTEQDLVIMVVSGGGSALLCQPNEGTSFEDENRVVSALMQSGATIQDTNIVRKHLSTARGGGLAFAAFPATVASLIFSDVPGDDIAFISSGPTVFDVTTSADARRVLETFTIEAREEMFLETPKDKKVFESVVNTVVVSNNVALEAMRREAVARGYSASIVTSTFTGESKTAVEDVFSKLHSASQRSVLLFGGETTVSSGVHSGVGGRNQEMALAGLRLVAPDELLVCCASDGRDNTDAAGALCDSGIATEAAQKDMVPEEFLERHDSYAFFKEVGGHVMTGSTGSNVSDLIIALK